MKLQFDPNQRYQLDAVAAVVDLFHGQPRAASDHAAGQERTELGLGNRLTLSAEQLRVNTRRVQARNGIENLVDCSRPLTPDPSPVRGEGSSLTRPELSMPLDAWSLFDPSTDAPRTCPHFSVEMETGTGKTYVYLRTIFELSARYGFQKFIIVVPSVAIREGVLKNIELTAEHFRALYNNRPCEHFVYDARQIHRLRQFAASATLQIAVINIDAFRKNFTDHHDKAKSNVMYKESDKLSGRQPIEFVQAARPIVIIDEPQSVDSTEKSQEAIKALNPLVTLRYSATHRQTYNLVYRLDPVRAFELRLVKQVIVAGATAEARTDGAFIRCERIDYKSGIKARLRLHVASSAGPQDKSVTVKLGADLHHLSHGRACYQDGFAVAEIHAEPGHEFVRFNNGCVLRLGEELGGSREDVWRAQIRRTIERHLDKELQLRERGVKVLSLFFIDRVANYRGYDDRGQAQPGRIALAFEAALADLAQEPRYRDIDWLKLPVRQLHNGYFAADKKGLLKDTRGDTQADDEVYNLIMRDKERLLGLDEPLRFIFSHSALREGWDNPNVFQICTLNESHSAVKKRQEIGRGLRLPVDQRGQRVFDDSVNTLFVMANESYEDFARALQTEYADECDVTIDEARLRRHVRRDGSTDLHTAESPLAREFEALWARIQPRTTYRVEFDTDTLVTRTAVAIWRMDKIEPPKVCVTTGRLSVQNGSVAAEAVCVAEEVIASDTRPLPDLLTFLEHETQLTRSTLVRILKASGRLGEFLIDPDRFMDAASAILKRELHRLLDRGIRFQRLGTQDEWEMTLATGPLESRLELHLPHGFQIETPLGTYHPDSAIMDPDRETLSFVRRG